MSAITAMAISPLALAGSVTGYLLTKSPVWFIGILAGLAGAIVIAGHEFF